MGLDYIHHSNNPIMTITQPSITTGVLSTYITNHSIILDSPNQKTQTEFQDSKKPQPSKKEQLNKKVEKNPKKKAAHCEETPQLSDSQP